MKNFKLFLKLNEGSDEKKLKFHQKKDAIKSAEKELGKNSKIDIDFKVFKKKENPFTSTLMWAWRKI